MKKAFISLSLTILVSTLFGIVFKDIYVFCIAFIFQFLFFYLFNSVYGNYLSKKALQLATEFERERSKNERVITCQCGHKSTQEVSLDPTKEQIYRCEDCGKDMRINIFIDTTLVTTPVYSASNG
tara:strand:- start:2739 stop:3113 length:375 start_codon:yes stop_codon:yes gene_type:complete